MEQVYKKLEIVGTSKTSIENAVENALAKASADAKNLRWFEIAEMRGLIEEGKVSYYQVTVKIGLPVD